MEICYYTINIFERGPICIQFILPVSLTSVICKVLEKIIVIQISEHLKANSLTCPTHHVFKAGHITVTILLEALNGWTEALMHRHPIDIIYLDYANSFDTVSHQRLLRQIYSLGIQGTTIDFIRAFLTCRRQRVRVNISYSTWEKCHNWCTIRFCIGTYAVHTLCLGCSPSSKMYCINVCGRYKTLHSSDRSQF